MKNIIEIWQPRYKDNKVLIAAYKIHKGTNYLKFTKAKHLEGIIFEFDGDYALNCPLQKNGGTVVVCLPFEKLKNTGEEEV